jgi:outer membrane protein TolC
MRTAWTIFTLTLACSLASAQAPVPAPAPAPSAGHVEGPPAAVRLTLAQCTARAVSNSKKLAAERSRLDAIRAQVEEVWWAPFSSIGVEAGFSIVPDRFLDTEALGRDGVLLGEDGAPVGAEDSSGDEWGPTFRLDVKATLPVVPFGRISRSRRAIEEAEKAKESQLPAVEQQIRYDVERAFHAIVGAREMLYTLGEGKKKLVKARELLQKKLEDQEGTETETDLIKLQVFEAQVAFTEQQTIQIERTALAALRYLVGGDDAARVDVPEDPQALVERELEPLESYEKLALENRPELAALRHSVKALEAKVALRKSEFFPTIGLVLGWKYAVTPGRTDIKTWVLNDDYNSNNWYAVLALKYDLDLALDIYKLAEAKADLAALTSDQQNALQAIDLEVETTYQKLVTTRDSLRELERSRRLTRGWIAAAVQANEAGLGPAKEIKDALKEYFQIMASIHQLTGQYNAGLAELDKVSGVLGGAHE